MHALWRRVLLLMAVVGMPLMAIGDDKPPEVIHVEISPGAAPSPALKYRLLPRFIEQTPGNAASMYMRAIMTFHEGAKAADVKEEELDRWLNLPLDQLPRDEVRKTLGAYNFQNELHIAARREHCDFELPLREQKNVFAILLPELQAFRSMSRVLALQARLQIAEGRYDEAADTLRTGFAMGRHVSEGPFLLHELVGIAVTRIMLQPVRDWETQADAPNLYWSLTALPDRWIDMQKSLELEGDTIYLMFPQLKDLDKQELNPEGWQVLLNQILEMITQVESYEPKLHSYGGNPLASALAVVKIYSSAKADLMRRGRTSAEVDAMSAAQVVLLYTRDQYERQRDEFSKWPALPYWQAAAGIEAVEKDLAKEQKDNAASLASSLLPALGTARLAEARVERDFAVARIVAALQLYAAAHDGNLPEQLSDITEVPIPQDPTHGRAFEYHREGQKATLFSAVSEHSHSRGDALALEITVRKPASK